MILMSNAIQTDNRFITVMLKYFGILFLLFVFLVPLRTNAEDSNTSAIIGANISTRTMNVLPSKIENITVPTDIKGWNHLFGLLVQQGISPHEAHSILADPRMPKYEPLSFNIHPSERHILYKKRNSSQERSQAMAFYRENRQWFNKAEQIYQVPASIVVSLLQIETRCGRFLGKKPVFYYLARLASGSSQDSIIDSYSFNKRKYKDATLAAVKARGEWLQNQFLPHVIATIKIADERGVSPHEILGSYGGAMGMPQFLPEHQYNYGIDANQNGIVDLNSPPDAILSVANYLSKNGWTKLDLPSPQRRLVIWRYNHSEPYVTTTLAMADNIDKQIKGNAPTSTAKTKKIPNKLNKIKRNK